MNKYSAMIAAIKFFEDGNNTMDFPSFVANYTDDIVLQNHMIIAMEMVAYNEEYPPSVTTVIDSKYQY